MPLLEKNLFIKSSGIPNAGKGLFTKKFIAKGERIVQYKGRMITWKQANEQDSFNGYVYYIKRDLVIDAKNFLKTFARFANDAKGTTKIKGLNNNCRYVVEGKKVFIEAEKDIVAGGEILVAYGKDYWDVIKYNKKHGYL